MGRLRIRETKRPPARLQGKPSRPGAFPPATSLQGRGFLGAGGAAGAEAREAPGQRGGEVSRRCLRAFSGAQKPGSPDDRRSFGSYPFRQQVVG